MRKNSNVSSFIGDAIGRVVNKMRAAEVYRHHGGKIPFGDDHVGQAGWCKHGPEITRRTATLDILLFFNPPHCNHHQVGRSLRGVLQ